MTAVCPVKPWLGLGLGTTKAIAQPPDETTEGRGEGGVTAVLTPGLHPRGELRDVDAVGVFPVERLEENSRQH